MKCTFGSIVMMNCIPWILLLILPKILLALPLENHQDSPRNSIEPSSPFITTKPENSSVSDSSQIISVRITSSVAIARGNKYSFNNIDKKNNVTNTPLVEAKDANEKEIGEYYGPLLESSTNTISTDVIGTTMQGLITVAKTKPSDTEIIPNLAGANLDFIKQLNARTTERSFRDLSSVEPSDLTSDDIVINKTGNIQDEPLGLLDTETDIVDENYDDIPGNVPFARSVSSQSFKNIFQDLNSKGETKKNSEKITTVSFDIIHDFPSIKPDYDSEKKMDYVPKSDVQNVYNRFSQDYSQPAQIYSEPAKLYSEPAKSYSEPAKLYSEPAKLYSEPAKLYSEPARSYSEPAQFYSEPAKIYSEPAKIYSEPAKVYSEPAKYYSEPASLHISREVSQYSSWKKQSLGLSQNPNPDITSTTPLPPTTTEELIIPQKTFKESHKEKNYEVDEKVSVLTNGRVHGIQEQVPEPTQESCKQENCKVGYVVEGRQYRKYRVEERTSDGFIVGEYGVVRNVDGALRGVRYTADSEASPRLIYDALMKFLQL